MWITSGMDRRAFLRMVGGGAGAALLPWPLRPWAVPAQSPQRVIVIGAGLAGLTAAYELAQHGHRVVVLEARPRPGGRVFTLHHPFDDGLHAEAGGEWIHPEHHYIRHYVQEFGLELQPDQGATGVLETGEVRPLDEAEKRIQGWLELQRQLVDYLKKINVFERPDRSALAHLDKMSYLAFLRQLGASERAIGFEGSLVSVLMTVDIAEISALHILYEYGLPQPQAVESRIRGGNSLLVEALARRLGERLRLGAAVTAIRWDAGGVQVHFRQRDQEWKEDTGHVIVAVTGTQVRHLRFEPGLPSEIARAYAALNYGRVMKVVLQSRERFWEKKPPVYQDVLTEQDAGHVYHSSRGHAGPRGLLTCYAGAQGADHWGLLTSPEKIAAARRLVGEIWAGGSASIEKGTSHFWNAQRWIRGSYAAFGPGEMVSVRPFLAQPVERIHFAGEHTAVWQGYMNGAVESGLRAAAEIEPAVGTLFRELTSGTSLGRIRWHPQPLPNTSRWAARSG